MYCTKCGAQIPDGSTFCTSCGARVGGVEDQAEPVAFSVGDAPATAPQGAPAHMAAQPRYEESVTEPAEASQPSVPTPQSKKPKHKGRIVAAVIGGVAVVAIVAAIVVVPRIGVSSEVTSGGKGYIIVLDTGEFDCMAWDTHDLVAHAFDSSYSCGQDVTPERAKATYVPNE